MTQSTQTDRLAELIGVKHELLRQIHRLSQQQIDTIARGDTTLLLRLLAAKQKMLDQLKKVDCGLDPFRRQDPESRAWRTQEDRRRAAEAARQCESLLKEIMTIEQQAESALRQRRDDAATRLQGVHGATEARKAYFQTPDPLHNQLDIHCES